MGQALNYLMARAGRIARIGSDEQLLETYEHIKAYKDKLDLYPGSQKLAYIRRGDINFIDESSGMSQAQLIDNFVNIIKALEKEQRKATVNMIFRTLDANKMMNAIKEQVNGPRKQFFKMFPQTFVYSEDIPVVISIHPEYVPFMDQTPIDIPVDEEWLERMEKKRLLEQEGIQTDEPPEKRVKKEKFGK